MSCPLCAHCQQAEKAAATLDPAALSELRAAYSRRRPYEHIGYGTDGRLTGIVDWYDGWDQGLRTDEPDVPVRIVNKVEWLDGWTEGRRDSTRFSGAVR